MAHHLDLIVVAEGIEERDQQQDLVRRNCDLLQGFYFARPMPQEVIMALPNRLPLPAASGRSFMIVPGHATRTAHKDFRGHPKIESSPRNRITAIQGALIRPGRLPRQGSPAQAGVSVPGRDRGNLRHRAMATRWQPANTGCFAPTRCPESSLFRSLPSGRWSPDPAGDTSASCG